MTHTPNSTPFHPTQFKLLLVLNMACNGCHHTLQQSLDLFSSFESAYTFFKSHLAIPEEVLCTSCGRLTKMNPKQRSWRCQRARTIDGVKVPCKFKRTLKSITWMNDSRLSLEIIGKLLTFYLLLPPPHQQFIQSELHISKSTVVDWSMRIREAELSWCLENTSQVIGGPGTIVEVDEAKFGRRKYNRGRAVEGDWVFGGVQRGTKAIFLEVVPDRTQETLMEIIHRRILQGTTIITDGWRAYNAIAHEGTQ